MATKKQSLTVPVREKAREDCHCGCAPCDGTCCRLDCIVQPRFFCGQLLTDADLSALLKWARDRFGLSRYRHGWGVVCGLDVRCKPGEPTTVIVTPGYAVDCCGDDIIVCEDTSLDLKGACREQEDPCADLRRQFGAAGEVSGFKDRLRAVDIYLRYDEMLSDSSTAMGRSSCKQVAECEYSRTRETYKLSWDLGVVGSDPVRARAQAWHEEYEKCIDVLKKFRAQFGTSFPAADVRRWLLRWIDEHPQYSLCYLRERLCGEEDVFFTREENLVLVLFAFVQICRNTYLNCDCFHCDEDARVPLARVWLLPDDRTTGEECRIVTIDPYPPYRRPIQPECWPAPLGSVNVGRFIWHRWDEVCPAVASLGLDVDIQEFTLPQTLDDLATQLDCDLFVKCDERRVALVYNADVLGDRVIGFCETAVKPTPETLDLAVKKTCSASATQAGSQVVYQIEVANTGNGELTVKVEDPLINLSEDLGLVPPGQSRQITRQHTVPENASGKYHNEVKVTGAAAGKSVTKTGTHDLTILPSEKLLASKFDEYGDIDQGKEDFLNEKARLDNFAIQLQNTPAAQGYIIGHAGLNSQIDPLIRANRAKDYLVNTRGVEAGRLVAAKGDGRPDFAIAVWIVPPGASPPPSGAAAPTEQEENFTQINHIGPARASTLHDAGIKTFAQLAATPIERLKGLFSGVPGLADDVLESWIHKARELAGF